MKHLSYIFIFLAGAFLATNCAAQGDAFDGIAAVVNGSPITYLQVQDRIILQLNALQNQYRDDRTTFLTKAREVQKDELDQLIQSKLIMDEFNKGEYSTNWVEPAVQDAIKQDIKERYGGSRAKLIKTLQVNGQTFEDYTRQQREIVIVGALAHFHTGSGKIIISPSAIEKYYSEHKDDFKVEDQVKLRMIPVPQPSGAPSGTAREMAAEILQKIDGGVSFAEMAKVYSTGADRAAGGDCGWVDRKRYLPQLTDVAFALKPGQHSKVVEVNDDRSGSAICYILMVDDVRPAHVSPLPEVQAEIERTLQMRKAKSLQDQWIERLKAKSHVEYF